jgi:hypothetical protein
MRLFVYNNFIKKYKVEQQAIGEDVKFQSPYL